MPMVILEATGHYYKGFVTLLVQEEGIPYYIVNQSLAVQESERN
ncbi:IS110 family transposase [Paenibacillus durus]|nr:IS110 family transposase [Paenibacillus durus]